MTNAVAPSPPQRLPPWFKVRLPGGPNYARVKGLARQQQLHTICEEARCPNIGECWEAGTATFLILGDVCTRACRYCAVTSGRPAGLDLGEPLRLARTVAAMGLAYVVITSVNRDDVPDGGASVFAACLRAIRHLRPGTAIELLIPDFMGSAAALQTVVHERPEVLNHNIETVARLFPRVRHRGDYQRSLALLAGAKAMAPTLTTKSGLMVGLGEEEEELIQTFADLRQAQVDVLTVGQYLRPTLKHHPVARFYTPDDFSRLAERARDLGFRRVIAGPLVRSSYHAREHVA